jgi:hypothetical protein
MPTQRVSGTPAEPNDSKPNRSSAQAPVSAKTGTCMRQRACQHVPACASANVPACASMYLRMCQHVPPHVPACASMYLRMCTSVSSCAGKQVLAGNRSCCQTVEFAVNVSQQHGATKLAQFKNSNNATKCENAPHIHTHTPPPPPNFSAQQSHGLDVPLAR